jgi:hypothetical protein
VHRLPFQIRRSYRFRRRATGWVPWLAIEVSDLVESFIGERYRPRYRYALERLSVPLHEGNSLGGIRLANLGSSYVRLIEWANCIGMLLALILEYAPGIGRFPLLPAATIKLTYYPRGGRRSVS